MKKLNVCLLGLTFHSALLLEAQVGVSKPVITPAPVTAPDAALPSYAPGDVPPPSEAVAPGVDLAAAPGYVIGPTDVLLVTVWKEPNFSGTFTVRPDGVISLPLLGDVPSSGMTPLKLSDELVSRLKKYINTPLVTVSVQSVNSKRVYMVGQVGRVGPLALTPNMTPLQAISTAGGPGTFANLKHIYILRTTNGKQQRIPFNYKAAVKNGDMQGIVLEPGDTIVVP